MAGDASYASVSLLLHGNGTNGSTTFADTSPTPKSVTQTGGASISTAQSKFGGASIANTTASYLAIPTHADFDFGTASFTLEFQVYLTSTAGDIYFLDRAGTANGFRLELYLGSLSFYSNATNILSFAWAPSTATWYHMALVRNGTNIAFYVDGVQKASAAYAPALNTGGTGFRLGNFGSTASYGTPGYFDEVRITKGVARYTGAFTPPTEAFGDTVPLVATGFTSTAFGTPVAIAAYDQIEDATGFTSTHFGTPRLVTITNASGFTSTQFGTPQNIPNAVGFCSTQFGTPSVALIAVGFTSTHFGTPIAFSRNRATSLGQTSRFGTPTTPTNRTEIATGFSTSRFGTPTALPFAPVDLTQTGIATGFRSTRFGTPTAAASIICQATGLAPGSQFGTPIARTSQRCTATGVAPASNFGTPTVRIVGRASGVHSTQFGTPTVRLIQQASGIAPTSRFGTPSQWGAHRAAGFCSSRFGQPSATNRINHQASGFCSSNFGTPSAIDRLCRATSIAPTSRFGTPLLKRNPACIDRYLAASLGQTSRFGTPRAIRGT